MSVFLVPYCCWSSRLFFYLLHINSGVELSLSLLLYSCVLSLLFLIFVVVFGFLLIYMYILMLFYCCLMIKFCHYFLVLLFVVPLRCCSCFNLVVLLFYTVVALPLLTLLFVAFSSSLRLSVALKWYCFSCTCSRYCFVAFAII